VLAGDALILNNPSNPVIDLILTISFLNERYTDGVIEFIALKVTNSQGGKKLYIACNELDSLPSALCRLPSALPPPSCN
jgi:hypothetical protein